MRAVSASLLLSCLVLGGAAHASDSKPRRAPLHRPRRLDDVCALTLAQQWVELGFIGDAGEALDDDDYWWDERDQPFFDAWDGIHDVQDFQGRSQARRDWTHIFENEDAFGFYEQRFGTKVPQELRAALSQRISGRMIWKFFFGAPGEKRKAVGAHLPVLLEDPLFSSRYQLLEEVENADGTVTAKFRLLLREPDHWSSPKKSTFAPEDWTAVDFLIATQFTRLQPGTIRPHDGATVHVAKVPRFIDESKFLWFLRRNPVPSGDRTELPYSALLRAADARPNHAQLDWTVICDSSGKVTASYPGRP